VTRFMKQDDVDKIYSCDRGSLRGLSIASTTMAGIIARILPSKYSGCSSGLHNSSGSAASAA
jgi:hypothetical protein